MPVYKVLEEEKLFEICKNYQTFSDLRDWSNTIFLAKRDDKSGFLSNVDGRTIPKRFPFEAFEKIECPVYVRQNVLEEPLVAKVWRWGMETKELQELNLFCVDPVSGTVLCKSEQGGNYEPMFSDKAYVYTLPYGKFRKIVDLNDKRIFWSEEDIDKKIDSY